MPILEYFHSLRHGACAAAMAVIASAATAQTPDEARSAHLSDMFRQMPASAALPSSDLSEITFFDIRAGIRSLGFQAIGADAGTLLARSISPALGETIFFDIETGWPLAVGFAPLDIQYGLTASNPPAAATILMLSSGAAAGVAPALLGQGYDSVEHPIGSAYARLSDDYAFDLENRNQLDPFGGTMGSASRVGLRGDMLFQTRGWAEFNLITSQPSPNLTDLAPVQSLFAAIDGPAFDGYLLVRAFLVTDPSTYYDPIGQALLGQDTDIDIDAIAETLGIGQGPRIPLWTTGIYADMSNVNEDLGVLIMAFGSRADAKAAQDLITQLWPVAESAVARGTYQEIFNGSPTFAITGDSPAALAMILQSERNEDDVVSRRNATYLRLLATYWRRDMPFLSPI